MFELSYEHLVFSATCFAIGAFAGYKMRFRNSLSPLSALGLKESFKLVLVVRDDLKMGKGKMAAQCCHGAVAAYIKSRETQPTLLNKWEGSGQPKVVVKATSLEELRNLREEAKKIGVTACLICDAGRTQLEPGTATVLAIGPDTLSNVNKVTGHLKLL